MKNIFLVSGYGMPEDIFKDHNYNFYLKSVFNKIYDLAIQNNNKGIIIICSGGKTDCFKPYKRDEANEILKFLKYLSQRYGLKKVTKNWKFIKETRSLSSLENILNAQKLIKNKKIKKAKWRIFCEHTRKKKVETLAKKILNKSYDFEVLGIDFDVSPNRYLESKFLAEKERKDLNNALWALKSSENLKKYHKLLEERISFLRKNGTKIHREAIKAWWEERLKELR